MNIYIYIAIALVVLFLIYIIAYNILNKKVQKIENAMIGKFLLKVSKIPALIEVMRKFVADGSAFDSLTKLHSMAMIHKYESIYALLEHNSRIQQDFGFLMKLSMQIPELQKHGQFIYIRDFVMDYERNIKKFFASYNASVKSWNTFVTIKNCTIIGFLLPGKKKELI